MPAWLLAMITTPESADASFHDPSGTGEPIRDGSRNTTLASLAGTMRRRGITAEEIYAALAVVNAQRCEPPLTDKEVRRITQSVARYAPAAVSPTAPSTCR
jgi:putative DNA primase/helicase